MLAITDDRFKRLFTSTVMEVREADLLSDPDSGGHASRGDYIRTMTNYKLVDLDGDGFVDILEETSVDKIHLTPDADTEFKDAKQVERISLTEHKYIWNAESNHFVQIR